MRLPDYCFPSGGADRTTYTVSRTVDGVQFIEAPNVTATEVDQAYERLVRETTERLSRAMYLGDIRANSNTLQIEDVMRFPRVMEGLPRSDDDVRYPRELAAQALRSFFDLGALGTAAIQFLDPPRPDPEAEARGEQLLKEWLSPAQLQQYEEQGAFEVLGRETGTRYRITKGRTFNVHELDRAGRFVSSLCFAPEGHLATGDIMLAQKVALETHERAALTVANRQSQSQPVFDLRPGAVYYVNNPEVERSWFRQLFDSRGT